MNNETFDPNAADTEMRERRAARERFEMDALTPFEKFQALAKKVVRVTKKDIAKQGKIWKTARKTKKKKTKKIGLLRQLYYCQKKSASRNLKRNSRTRNIYEKLRRRAKNISAICGKRQRRNSRKRWNGAISKTRALRNLRR